MNTALANRNFADALTEAANLRDAAKAVRMHYDGVLQAATHAKNVASTIELSARLHPENAAIVDRWIAAQEELANINALLKEAKDALKGLKYADFGDNFIQHVFEGEVNKASKGFHYRAGGIDPPTAKVVSITTPPVPPGLPNSGVYQARIQVWDAVANKWAKAKPSTFFPDNWTPQQVLDVVEEAFRNKAPINPADPRAWKGTTSSGFKVEGFFDPQTGKIITAYPKEP